MQAKMRLSAPFAVVMLVGVSVMKVAEAEAEEDLMRLRGDDVDE